MGGEECSGVVNCKTLVGNDVAFVFRGKRFNVGEGDAFLVFIFIFIPVRFVFLLAGSWESWVG